MAYRAVAYAEHYIILNNVSLMLVPKCFKGKINRNERKSVPIQIRVKEVHAQQLVHGLLFVQCL